MLRIMRNDVGERALAELHGVSGGCGADNQPVRAQTARIDHRALRPRPHLDRQTRLLEHLRREERVADAFGQREPDAQSR